MISGGRDERCRNSTHLPRHLQLPAAIIGAWYTWPSLKLADELGEFGETCCNMIFDPVRTTVQGWSKLVVGVGTILVCGNIFNSRMNNGAILVFLFVGAMIYLFAYLLAIPAGAAAAKSAAYLHPKFGRKALPLVMLATFLGPFAVFIIAATGARLEAGQRHRDDVARGHYDEY